MLFPVPRCLRQQPKIFAAGPNTPVKFPGHVAKPRLSSYELSYATRKLDPPSPRQRPAARDMSAWLGLPDVSGQDVAACADALASARRAVRFHRHQPLDAFRPAQVQDLRLLEECAHPEPKGEGEGFHLGRRSCAFLDGPAFEKSSRSEASI